LYENERCFVVPFFALLTFGIPTLGANLSPDGHAVSFDSDWRFFARRGSGRGCPSFDDKGWRVLDLPHDWSIEICPPPTVRHQAI